MTKKIPAQCFHPGEYVSDEIAARGWSVEELAKRMAQTPATTFGDEFVKDFVNCKQDVTPFVAFALHRAFGTSAELWMNLQAAYDEWKDAQMKSKPE